MDTKVQLALIHQVYAHPFETCVIVALAALFLWNLRGYFKRSIKISRIHTRPQEYLPLAALAAELIHVWKGC